MLKEEIEHRKMDELASKENERGETYFDAETGMVINTETGPLYSIAFNEDETDYVYNDIVEEESEEVSISSIKVGNKIVGYKTQIQDRDITDVYKDWNYQDDIDE